MTATRTVILISGAPGAGKTTIAVPLAAALGPPLLSKDRLKETLFDALAYPSGDLAASRQVGGAAMELLWSLAESFPSVMLEANFRPHSDYERGRITELNARIVEVNCSCPPAVAAERFAARAGTPGHHGAHTLTQLPAEILAEYDRPVGVGHVIRLDTSAPVDIDELAATIRRLGDH